MSSIDMSRNNMAVRDSTSDLCWICRDSERLRSQRKGVKDLKDTLRKKYIPMTETIYYTLLALTCPRHGYAVMQYVSTLTAWNIRNL